MWHFRNYNDMSLCLWRNLWKLPHKYDLIVGIPRSGMIPATMLSLYLHAQLSSLDEFCEGRTMKSGITRMGSTLGLPFPQIKHVLVVDDSIWSGQSIRNAKQRINQTIAQKYSGMTIDYCAVYSKSGQDPDIDFSFEIVPTPRRYQWNFLHQAKYCRDSLFDIDGVVCRDPTEEENDDGPRYLQFITTVKPKISITFPVGGFVSSRLEKYRHETEEWLHRNGFVYNKLFMLNLPSKEARIKQNAHAPFKAAIYKNRPETFFFFFYIHQAETIARLSGKDVLCTDYMRLFHGHN